MSAYYNEFEPYAAQWLRNLIAADLIAPGDVDERSIKEVKPDDLAGYDQCHFFAGIGGWSLAARLAGWPDSRPLWTGSCPCQPFSVAGRGKGVEDPRHLWPDFYRLIRGSRPVIVMGEQTSAKPGYAWLDGVGSDLETEAYAWRAVDIPACSVNAPTRRNRIYWMAHSESERLAADLLETCAPHRGGHPQFPVGWRGEQPYRLRRSLVDTEEWAGATASASAVEPAVRKLPYGHSTRVAITRAIGNSICPQLAAEVIRAYIEATA